MSKSIVSPAVAEKVVELNSNLNTLVGINVTPTSDVVIDTNASYRMGNVVIFNVKGHVTANKNAALFTFDPAPNGKYYVAGFTFPIGIGGQWEIISTGYGYLRYSATEKSIVGIVNNGNYFHINVVTFMYDV